MAPISSLPYSWALASAAVQSFDCYSSIQPHQNLALHNWYHWKWAYFRPDTFLHPQHFPTLTKIFSDLFFLGRLEATEVRWQPLRSDLVGLASKKTLSSPTMILLNSESIELRGSMDLTLEALLHEMCHAFLHQSKGVAECLSGTAERVAANDPDLGLTEHGRAFMHLAQSIEGRMGSLLRFPGKLHRDVRMWTEIDAIINHCCRFPKDAQQLMQPLAEALIGFKCCPPTPYYSKTRLMHFIELYASEGWKVVVELGEMRTRRRSKATEKVAGDKETDERQAQLDDALDLLRKRFPEEEVNHWYLSAAPGPRKNDKSKVGL